MRQHIGYYNVKYDQFFRLNELATDTVRVSAMMASGELVECWTRATPPQPAPQPPYAWVNAGTEQQQTEYATLHVGPENPWVEIANAFPVFRYAVDELVAASVQQGASAQDDFLAWWTSIETDTRKELLVGALTDKERLHALLRMAYEAARKEPKP